MTWVTEHWSHFEYTSGANPYIAKTNAERDRVMRRWEKRGVLVEEIPYSSNESVQFFMVHDREEEA